MSLCDVVDHKFKGNGYQGLRSLVFNGRRTMGRVKWVVSGYPTSYRGAYVDEPGATTFSDEVESGYNILTT